MAKFLTTTGVSDELRRIITDATEKLFLISPYLKVSRLNKEFIERKNREFLGRRDRFDLKDLKKIFDRSEKKPPIISIIYGKKRNQLDKPEISNWLASLPPNSSITIRFRENLHAKCYLNENEALLTSMNLHEYSQQNNDEMGILVSRKEDRKLYDDISEDAARIEEESVNIFPTPATGAGSKVAKDGERSSPENYSQKTQGAPKDGFCIRCKAALPANPAQPYCRRCYANWNRYKNEEYEEKYCHTCGSEYVATRREPVCRGCL